MTKQRKTQTSSSAKSVSRKKDPKPDTKRKCVMTKEEMKDLNLKKYYFNKNCYEVDAKLKKKHLDVINKNKNIEIFNTNAGGRYERKPGRKDPDPAIIMFVTRSKNLCTTSLKEIPNTVCERTPSAIDSSLSVYSIYSENDNYKKWWKDAHKVVGKIGKK